MRYLSSHPCLRKRYVLMPPAKTDNDFRAMWELSFLTVTKGFEITYHATWEGAIAYLCLSYKAKLVKKI